jgi:hypothetical protein
MKNEPDPKIVSCERMPFGDIYEVFVFWLGETFTLIYDGFDDEIYCEGLWTEECNIPVMLSEDFKSKVKKFINAHRTE